MTQRAGKYLGSQNLTANRIRHQNPFHWFDCTSAKIKFFLPLNTEWQEVSSMQEAARIHTGRIWNPGSVFSVHVRISVYAHIQVKSIFPCQLSGLEP